MTHREAIERLSNLYRVVAVNGIGEYNSDVRHNMAIDLAIEALKAQEPRLMTLEEYRAMAERPLDERDPLWEEWRSVDSRWVMPAPGYGGYGTSWRCWTSRPTDEQRAAEAWPDLPEA